MLCTRKQALVLMNELAKVIQVIEECTDYSDISAHPDHEVVVDQTCKKMDGAMRIGFIPLIEYITDQIKTIQDRGNEDRFLIAKSIVFWFNTRLSYDKSEDQKHLQIPCLLPEPDDVSAAEIYLNNNADETGIFIFPLFPTAKYYSRDDSSREHRAHNKNALHGMNDELHSFGYRKSDDNPVVLQSILWLEPPDAKHVDQFRIGFTPMTSKNNVLYEDNVEKGRYGKRTTRNVTGIKDPVLCEERFAKVLNHIAEKELAVDFLFGPELLGTDGMYVEDEDGALPYIMDKAANNRQNGKVLPRIVMLPSHSKDGMNYVCVTNGEGVLLGKQYKRFPSDSSMEHIKEYLVKREKNEILLIHIPGQQRIAILICADFLPHHDPAWSEYISFIMKYLHPSLLIVPSYSSGEEDFIKEIPGMRSTGTSVIWGNCCAASKSSDRIIGAISISGIDTPARMSGSRKCEGMCNNTGICLFYVDIPLKVQLNSSEETRIQFQHICV